MAKEELNEKIKGTQPSMEFEGPTGMFWSIEDVPAESLAISLVEICKEIEQRGFDIMTMVELGKELKAKKGD